jgi:hypothetical protein
MWGFITGKRFKRKEADYLQRVGLEAVLCRMLPNQEDKQKTVLGVYDAFVTIREKYFYSVFKEEDGMMALINYDSRKYDAMENPPIELIGIHDFLPTKVEGSFSVHDKAGKKKLEEYLYNNGVIEIDAVSGNLMSVDGYIYMNLSPKHIAQQRGVISLKSLGFNEDERKKRGGKRYKGLGTRQLVGITATGLNSDLIAVNLSRQAMGVISIFNDYKIPFSSIESEIHPDYRPVYDLAKKMAPPYHRSMKKQ